MKPRTVPSYKTIAGTPLGVQDDSYMFKSPFRRKAKTAQGAPLGAPKKAGKTVRKAS
jgi:hypothetical protein